MKKKQISLKVNSLETEENEKPLEIKKSLEKESFVFTLDSVENKYGLEKENSHKNKKIDKEVNSSEILETLKKKMIVINILKVQ